MRAVVFDGESINLIPRHVEPTTAPGEALIRPLKVGICATDLEICRGYMDYRGVLGHEFVGMVEEIDGDDPRGLRGKRVVGGINAVCLECDRCRAGLKMHCRHRTVLGILGRDGCFADRFTLPERNLVPVPDHVDDDTAVFAEPVAAALHAARQLHVEGKPFITVLGDGRLGLLCAQAMAPLNASVRLVGKHPAKLGLCEKWGIRHRHLDDVGRRGDQDIVVDCTGSPTGLEVAMQMVRPRGTILLKTTTAPDAQSVDLSPIVINELDVIGSRCGSIPDAIDALAGKRFDVLSLISHRYSLNDATTALQTAAQSDSIKVLMEV